LAPAHQSAEHYAYPINHRAESTPVNSSFQQPSKTSAWKVTPSDYALDREFDFEIPTAPQSLHIPMSDGIRLATDVFIPQVATDAPVQPRPTILVFTPYYRRFARKGAHPKDTVELSPNTARYRDLFVPAGYNVIVVDVRGTGASFGHREGFRSPKERNDYIEVIDWVIDQPWSNGRVGITGISYLGAAADFAASTGHPAIKAIAPLFSVWDTYENNYFPGGIQLNDLIDSYAQMMIGLDQDDREAIQPYAAYAHPSFNGPAPVDADTDGLLRDAAVAEHRANYRHADMMREFVMREKPLPYDSNYSSASFSPYAYSAGTNEDVAIYSVSGWMDGAGYANGALERYLTLSSNPRHLLLGPWDHGARSHVSPWNPNGLPDESWWYDILRFFDEYLLGIDTGIRDEDPIHYYTMHAEQWHSADTWPPSSDNFAFELTSIGGLRAVDSTPNHNNDNDKRNRGIESATVLNYPVDFATKTGTNTRYERISGKSPGPYYSDWQGRTSTHLCFDSPPLDRSIEISGHAMASILLGNDQPDGNLFVYLTEVESDGTERYVTEGLLRLLHRAEAQNPPEIATKWIYRTFREEDAHPFRPDTPKLIRVPLLPTAWRFAQGSRIRLSIAGADSDHATQNPHGRPPHYSVTVGGPSTLVIPVAEQS
jgi:putative CocE/NonD family hydrolase